jgi:hypothetical protein
LGALRPERNGESARREWQELKARLGQESLAADNHFIKIVAMARNNSEGLEGALAPAATSLVMAALLSAFLSHVCLAWLVMVTSKIWKVAPLSTHRPSSVMDDRGNEVEASSCARATPVTALPSSALRRSLDGQLQPGGISI